MNNVSFSLIFIYILIYIINKNIFNKTFSHANTSHIPPGNYKGFARYRRAISTSRVKPQLLSLNLLLPVNLLSSPLQISLFSYL